jgi:hypothetical protein
MNILDKRFHRLLVGESLLFTYCYFCYPPFQDYKIIEAPIEPVSQRNAINDVFLQEGSPVNHIDKITFDTAGIYHFRILKTENDTIYDIVVKVD